MRVWAVKEIQKNCSFFFFFLVLVRTVFLSVSQCTVGARKRSNYEHVLTLTLHEGGPRVKSDVPVGPKSQETPHGPSFENQYSVVFK